MGEELRLKCKSCGEYIAAEQLRPHPNYHYRTVYVGAGWPRIGCRMEQRICGPVEQVSVGEQEQFVEWLEGKRND